MRWLMRAFPLSVCMIGTVLAAQYPQKTRARAQVNSGAGAAGQTKTVNPAAIAKNYQRQPGIQGQLTLTPASQTSTTNEPVTVTAICASGFTCVSFHFVWGDGEEDDSNQATSRHTYGNAGSYTVYATSQAAPNLSIMMASSKRTQPLKSNPVTVAVTAPPVEPQGSTAPSPTYYVVTLDGRPSRARVRELITFTATLTPPDGEAQFTFDFGDGTKSLPGPNVVRHRYADAGDYQVTVTATNSDHMAVSNSVPVTVAANRAPVVTIRVEPGQSLVTGRPIVFLASSRGAPPDMQYQFHWNDGTPDEIAGADGRAAHVFSSAGMKRVSVTGLTAVAFAGAIEGQTAVQIEGGWPPLWLLMLVIAAFGGAAIAAIKKGREWLRNRGVKVKITRMTSAHQVRLTGGAYPQVSFELHSGLESAEHAVVVEREKSKQAAGVTPVAGG